MTITIFDYGAGNIHSLAKALGRHGATVRVEPEPCRALDTDVLVRPGVGAFGAAARRLAPGRERMADAIRAGLPCLGICLGMQLLFESSDEATPNDMGLGVIQGRVTRLEAQRIPQIGWNSVEANGQSLLDAAPLPYAYYANSYVCRPRDDSVVQAWSEHDGDRFPAVVRYANTIGTQFHPEKSSTPGLQFLRVFLDRVGQ